MNTDRDKYLTEAMGECIHRNIKTENKKSPCGCCQYDYKHTCSDCGHFDYTDDDATQIFHPHGSFELENDFSTWPGFGKLWEWAQEQEWWMSLLTGWMDDVYDFPTALIAPDTFAIAVYEFLKGRE